MIRLTTLVHHLLAQHLRAGDHALDLTAGNGHDTLALARLVGAGGQVWAFDLQPAALEATRQRLLRCGCAEQVKLIQANHRDWPTHLPGGIRNLAAVVANLGYLPGSDQTVITSPDATLPALEAAWSALRPGGLLAVTIYRGHLGGLEEDSAIAAWVKSLPVAAEWHDPAPPRGPRLLILRRPPA